MLLLLVVVVVVVVLVEVVVVLVEVVRTLLTLLDISQGKYAAAQQQTVVRETRRNQYTEPRWRRISKQWCN